MISFDEDLLKLTLKCWKQLNPKPKEGWRKTKKEDEWFQDPNNPTSEELTRFEKTKENIKSIRCDECGKILPLNIKPCIHRITEEEKFFCRSCASDRIQYKKPKEYRYPGKKKKEKIEMKCEDKIQRDKNENSIPDSLLKGCNQWWQSGAQECTRMIQHLPFCEVFYGKI